MGGATDEAERETLEAYRAWQDAFNARDVEGMLARMHFPHARLAGAGLHVWESGEEFAAGQARMTAQLEAEGWARTDNLLAEVVHASEDKVHLSLRNARVDADGNAYHAFDALVDLHADRRALGRAVPLVVHRGRRARPRRGRDRLSGVASVRDSAASAVSRGCAHAPARAARGSCAAGR